MPTIEIVKVIREYQTVEATKEGAVTIGQLVDEAIIKAAEEGVEVQTVSFHVGQEEWHNMARVITEDITRKSRTKRHSPSTPTQA